MIFLGKLWVPCLWQFWGLIYLRGYPLMFLLWCARAIAPLDCFTVPLRSPNDRHLPAIRTVQGDCQWLLKNSGNSPQSSEPTAKAILTYIQTSQSGKSDACEVKIGGHVSCPIDDLTTTTRLGLWSSLLFHWHNQFRLVDHWSPSSPILTRKMLSILTHQTQDTRDATHVVV